MVQAITLDPTPFFLVVAVAAILGLAGCLWLAFLVSGLRKRYDRSMIGRANLQMDELLDHYRELMETESRRHDHIVDRLAKLETDSDRAVAGLGLVRFNAFREIGGDLSFSLALLNRSLDGVVLTSICGRDENRIYGKPITRGQSEYRLCEEEQDALHRAKKAMEKNE